MSTPAENQAQQPRKLTTQQKRFVEEYCVDWNCTQAAIRAGYSEKTARSIGSENLTKPDIRAAIDARLNELSLSAGQVTKLISNIAETSLNDFLTVKQVEQRTKIQQPLAEAIKQLEDEIAFDEEYAEKSADIWGHTGEVRAAYLADKQYDINRKRLEVLRFQMQLARNPEATTTVDGPPELVKRADLDLVKIAEAKEGNRIKSWQPSEFGTKIEFYDSAAALRDMGRVRGIFEKDNKQAATTAVMNATVQLLPAVGGVPLASAEKEVDDV
ncbi:terminase small subunit [Hymenobacter fodinae]|uniref:terminase small subunit n=1 Tax=Hymenobacter fodinae TaxID=2510796 RepID=UPI001AEBE329|nr:terminase small subunit [Hymenobacter fodinae]